MSIVCIYCYSPSRGCPQPGFWPGLGVDWTFGDCLSLRARRTVRQINHADTTDVGSLARCERYK